MSLLRVTLLLLGAGLLAGANCAAPDPYRCSAPFSSDGPLQLQWPRARMVYQQHGGVGAILLRGWYDGAPTAIEARWNGGPWRVIDPQPRFGVFKGSLPDQPIGRGLLEVRFQNDPAASTAVADVGVGNVLVLGGQSNMVMWLDTLSASQRGASALPQLVSPFDPQGIKWAVDPIHQCVPPVGSIWPGFGDRVIDGTGAPVMFIATAVSSTGLVVPPDWRPGSQHWWDMIEQVYEGTAGQMCPAAMLWLQGEADALHGVASDVYEGALVSFAEAFEKNMHCEVPIVVGVIGSIEDSGTVLARFADGIRAAQRAAPLASPHLRPGPETQDLPLNGVHFSDAAAPALIERWCAAIASLGLACAAPP